MSNYIGEVKVDKNGIVSLPSNLSFNSSKVVITLGKEIIYVFKPEDYQTIVTMKYDTFRSLNISVKEMIAFKRLFSANAYDSSINNNQMKLSKNYIKKLDINDSLFIEAYDNYFKLYRNRESYENRKKIY